MWNSTAWRILSFRLLGQTRRLSEVFLLHFTFCGIGPTIQIPLVANRTGGSRTGTLDDVVALASECLHKMKSLMKGFQQEAEKREDDLLKQQSRNKLLLIAALVKAENDVDRARDNLIKFHKDWHSGKPNVWKSRQLGWARIKED